MEGLIGLGRQGVKGVRPGAACYREGRKAKRARDEED